MADQRAVQPKSTCSSITETNTMIRPITQQDHQFITEQAHAFDHFGPYVPVFQRMAEGNHAALIGYGITGQVELFIHEPKTGQRTGFVAVEWRQTVGHIHGVVVDPKQRNTGVATQLLSHIVALAGQKNIQTLECITAEIANVPAYTFFANHGFENIGHAGVYPRGQSAVTLRRRL